tara:strand:- start:1243 stop:1350 length:108 start_codon:yes stop_codon:yes gene_type:complete
MAVSMDTAKADNTDTGENAVSVIVLLVDAQAGLAS